MVTIDYKFSSDIEFGNKNRDTVLLLGASGDTQPGGYDRELPKAWRKALYLSNAPDLQTFLQNVVQSDALFRPDSADVRSFGRSSAEVVGVDTLRINYDDDWFRTEWAKVNRNRQAVDFQKIGGGHFLLATMYPNPRNGQFVGQYIKIRPTLITGAQKALSGLGRMVYSAQAAHVYDSNNNIAATVTANKELGEFDKVWQGLIFFKTPDGRRWAVRDRDAIVR